MQETWQRRPVSIKTKAELAEALLREAIEKELESRRKPKKSFETWRKAEQESKQWKK